MTAPVIAISPSSFAQVASAPLDRLHTAGFTCRMNSLGRQLTADEAREHLHGAVGLVAGTEPLTSDVLESATGLRVISRVGTGLDTVDLVAARRLGIQVFNTPDAHVDAVAELSLAGILAAMRHVVVADRAVRERWRKPMGRLLRGTTVGLVGLGRVGKALVELLAPFGVTKLAFDPVRDDEFAARHAISYTTLDELLTRSDVVTLNLPYSKSAHHLIGEAELARMKPDAVLVNCARGKLIDEVALYRHLRDHAAAACHLDCFAEEPYAGPLRELDNVVLTPHIGGYARESRLRMENEAVDNLLRVLGAV
jgi:D-3-phosphoglycerate dehydrogenase / 2-oxoglutarate reductase